MKKGIWIFCCVALAYLSACQSNHSSKATSDSVQQIQSSQADTIPVEVGKDIVVSDAQTFIKETHRPNMKLLGKEVTLTVKNLPATIANLLPEITRVIQAQNLYLCGTLTVVYLDDNALKSNTALTKVFIGIPVRIRKANALQYYELAEGDYFKGIVNAAIGESLPNWKMMLQKLEASNQAYQAPRFEYFSDARNAEMTTVMAQTSMMVRKK